jgi:peptidoglycan/LPS O-acetylase OafA/YrhL
LLWRDLEIKDVSRKLTRLLDSSWRFATGADDAPDQRASANYRPDIDGLRAIAVLSVVLFHLDFATLGGGYVGVDIFFVISGYLIGKSILDQRRSGTFSLVTFYQKRLRRILPALVIVLVATTLAALFVLLPVAMEEYSRSVIFAILSISNILFWLETDYFASQAHEMPLLHTWSLGVEEQFYILFPLLLLLTRKAQRWDLAIIAAVTAASLGLSIFISADYPSANFYLIQTRAWELLAGVLVAEWRFAILARRAVREGIALAAIVVIAAVCLLYTPATLFPGLAAVPPVLASAMLLSVGAHGSTLVGRALSIRPMIFVGLISYSLYLWHWPVIVLIKQWTPEAWLRMPERIGALVVMTAMAWISWRFIERPFRSRDTSSRAIWIFSASSTAALLLAGAAIMQMNGLPKRFSGETVQLASYMARDDDTVRNPCQVGLYAPNGTFSPAACLEQSDDRPNVLLIGDSHANHLRHGLDARYGNIAFQQATAAGCRVTLVAAERETPTCAAFRAQLFERLERDPPEWVLISLFWSGQPFGSLEPTVKWLRQQGIKVIISGPVVRYEVAMPHVLALANHRGDPQIVERARLPGTRDLDARFRDFARSIGALYMSNYSAMCPDDECVTVLPNGQPVQLDSHHLTTGGSYLVAEAFPAAAVLGTAQEPSWPATTNASSPLARPVRN